MKRILKCLAYELGFVAALTILVSVMIGKYGYNLTLPRWMVVDLYLTPIRELALARSVLIAAIIGVLASIVLFLDAVANSDDFQRSKYSHASFIFGCFSVLCFLVFIPAFNNANFHMYVVFTPFLGLAFAILAIIAGIIASHREQSRIKRWGSLVSIMICGLMVLIVILPIASGSPFFCTNADACFLFHDDSLCSSLVCIPTPPPTVHPSDGGPGQIPETFFNDSSFRWPLSRISGILTLQLGNDKVLMGASHNVFVGRVIKQSGVRKEVLSPGVGVPISQFDVLPVMNIKGDLHSPVTVEQVGGYQNGYLIVGDAGDVFGPSNQPGGGYLMQVGSMYLFATRYEGDGVYYLWDFPRASKLIDGDNNRSMPELSSMARNDSRVQRLEIAYPDEILDTEDIRNNNTRNSYQSLTAAQKAALPHPDITLSAHPPIPDTSTQFVPPPLNPAAAIDTSTPSPFVPPPLNPAAGNDTSTP